MSNSDQQVYISYAWGGESERIANELDADLQANGITIIRDKRDLGYKGMIRDFMQQIGRGGAIVVIVSDKYLKSPNCMYELVEIAKNQNIHDRIFPIVLGDADIYNPVNRIKYIKHWEDKLKELDDAMRSISAANLDGMRDEIDSYDEIRDNISKLTFLFKDMNTLTPDMHEGSDFANLISILKKRLGDEPAQGVPALEVISEEKSETVKPAPEAGSIQAYLGEVTDRLLRDDYGELDTDRFGGLRFEKVLDRKDHYKALLMRLDEYHRFVFLNEEVLNEDRFIRLEKEIKEYCAKESGDTSSYVYTFGVILTDSVSDDVKECVYETMPAEYAFGVLPAVAMAIYSAEENDIYYAKVITESFNSDFSGKIKKYLRP